MASDGKENMDFVALEEIRESLSDTGNQRLNDWLKNVWPGDNPGGPVFEDVADDAALLAAKVVLLASSVRLERVAEKSFERQVILDRLVNTASNAEDAADFLLAVAGHLSESE